MDFHPPTAFHPLTALSFIEWFIAFLSLFIAPWLDCQRLVKLNHLAAARGQIDPNDESIARCRPAFRSTRCKVIDALPLV
jgi:hypothetical protein